MRSKLMFVAGLGIGYVLGTKAGRERYEQIVQKFREVKEHPTVQETAGVLQARTSELAGKAKDVVNEKYGDTKWGARVNDFLTEKVEKQGSPSGSTSAAATDPVHVSSTPTAQTASSSSTRL